MKNIWFIGLLALSPLRMAVADSYIEAYMHADKLHKSGDAGAFEAMKKAFAMAVEAGDENYADAAAVNGTERLYAQDKVVEAGAYASDCYRAIEAMPELKLPALRQQKRRIVLLGFRERGLQAEGKIGAAWQTNRQIAELLRGNAADLDGDGRAITVAEVVKLPYALADSGWRLIEREADYLDLAGRTNEAKAMLEDAAVVIKKQWALWTDMQRFYPLKILASHANLLDFLGYKAEAIAAQEELERMIAGRPALANNYVTLKMNLLRNQSQWFGPSEELLAEARAVSAKLRAKRTQRDMEGLLAKMELDLRHSREAMAALAKVAEEADSAYEAFYGKRDHLQARLNAGEKNLDADFQKMLLEVRKQGNKRGEPTIYREYGRFLLEDQRPLEALQMYREALRLIRTFGWTFHEVPVLSVMIQCHYEMSDRAGMLAVMAELEQYLRAHPELPQDRRFSACTTLALFWSELADEEKMQAAWNQALEAGKKIPAHQTSWVTPQLKQKILEAKGKFTGTAIAAIPPLEVQPSGLTSLAHAQDEIRAHFSVTNPTARPLQGHWVITGAAVRVSHQGKNWSNEAGTTTLRIPDRIAAGEVSVIVPRVAPGPGKSARVQVAWEHEPQAVGKASVWELRWGEAAPSQMILDASALGSNPFQSLALHHEVAILPESPAFLPCRITCSVPLRLEYYDPSSGELLAIDANGNGNLSEEGDLHLLSMEGQAAAMLPLPAGLKQKTLQVKIYALDGKAPNPSGEEILLTTEVFRGKQWMKEAVSHLK